MPKRKDLLLIALIVALAAAMLGVSKLMPKTDLSEKTADVTLAPDAIEYITPSPAPAEAATQAPTDAPAAEPTSKAAAVPTDAPQAAETSEPTAAPAEQPAQEAEMAGPVGPMPPKQTADVRGHVLLTVGGRQYGEAIPMDRDKIITLRQEDGKINKVHITPEAVWMESSTCDNQDCVGQGEVNVNTYKTRILSTYVICLPNNVSIEMVPAE